MEMLKRKYESEMSSLKISTALEIETVTEMAARSSRGLVEMTHKYDELDKQYKMYYMKSDAYIKDREQKLKELTEECADITEKYRSFDLRFQQETARGDAIQKQLDKKTKEFSELQYKNKRLRIEIVDYEQRYRGIDIGKLHEQVMYLESQLVISKSSEQALEKDLFELRDRIEAIMVKANAKRALTKKEKELRKKTPWVPENDLEQLCKMFVSFVSGPSNKTFETLAE